MSKIDVVSYHCGLLACVCYYLSHVVTLLDIKYFYDHADRGIDGVDKLASKIVLCNRTTEIGKENRKKNWSKAKEHSGTALLRIVGRELIADRCMTF